MKKFQLGFGNIVLALESESENLTVGKVSRSFLVEGRSPDISINARFGDVPDIQSHGDVFNPGEAWDIYKNNGKLIFSFLSKNVESTPHKLMAIEPDFKHGEIYSRVRETTEQGCFNPLSYPLDELLAVTLLARGKGVIVHACGLEYMGKGCLFLGTSGAGKTTMARLLQSVPGVNLFSDDRIIVAEDEGQYSIHGTPWHGTAAIASPAGAPLTKIFFLVHAKENQLTQLDRTDIASRLMVRCFPTFWDMEGMDYTVGLCGRLSADIPSFELGFVPDMRVTEMVLGSL